VVKGSVIKIVVYDVIASTNQGDQCIFPTLMVCLEKPFPDQ